MSPLVTDRRFYLTYKEYADRWEELASIFSKEAVLRGSFDRFVETSKGKRGTSPVDKEFLSEIEDWREALAKNLALRNPKLSVRDLNFAVQRTIDRIIFLRMCEDRSIETYGQLQALMNGENIYKRMHHLYRLADEKYNSGLFHFAEEKGRAEAPDKLTLNLKIDDKVLKDIIRRLYYPESPYEFSVLSADILGNVYEQFLGKVIRLTPGHRAMVEEKPEVKKAGGVYYTPAYIVEYIVKNTVGKLCEGNSPRQIEKVKILDPACGSGSFLIGAYKFLQDYHREWYFNDGPQKHTKQIYQGAGGHWYLTTQEKKRILLNNIYGVDVDSQAVEVTKLSLLLKVLEGENQDSLTRQLKIWRERALPDLGNNIKCGNSLIDPDFYQNKQISLLDDEDRYRINVFGWNAEFSEIMKAGGFDAVIGNPPYVRIQTMQEWLPESADHFKETYAVADSGNYDIYVVFIERGLSLASERGKVGFIMPQKFWQVQYGEALRKLLVKGRNVESLVNFTHNQVFADAFVNTCILILSKSPAESFFYTEVQKIKKGGVLSHALLNAPVHTLSNTSLGEGPWVLKSARTMELLEKLSKQGQTLEECTTRIFQGLKTSADKIYVLELIRDTQAEFTAHSPQLHEEFKLERGLCRKLIKGTEMRPYAAHPAKRIIIFPYECDSDSATLIGETQLKRQFPKTYSYLKKNEKYLRDRENGRMDHEGWYGYGRTQALDVMARPKIVTPDLAPYSSFLIDLTGEIFILGGAAGGYGILPKVSISSLYLLGLLNSRVLNFFITSSGQQMESGYYSFEARFIRSAPIRLADKARHDKMVLLVERMLNLHKQLATSKNPNDKTHLEREIESSDRQIDQLVYQLYDLTEEEIKIVEQPASI